MGGSPFVYWYPYDRWNSIDFVQGIEIDLSNNHPMYDICDELKGKYPKDFKFVGWHPHCRCIATPILPDPDHFERYLRRETDNPQDESGQIDEMPQEFKEWEKKNALRIARAEEKGKLPYFLRDNPHRRSKLFEDPKGEQKMHIKNEKTEARRKEIQSRWNERNKVRAYAEELPKTLSEKERIAIAKNSVEIEKALGIEKGRPMTIDEADKQSANPKYNPKFIPDPRGNHYDKEGNRFRLNPEYKESRDEQYSTNCQTCVPTFELRRRGFDITAIGNTEGSLPEYVSRGKSFDLWLNADGSKAKPTLYSEWMMERGYKQMTPKRYREFFEESCDKQGFYVLTIKWKNSEDGHATILHRMNEGKLLNIEPQVDNALKREIAVDTLCNSGSRSPFGYGGGILRIDDKLFNTEFSPSGLFLKSR